MTNHEVSKSVWESTAAKAYNIHKQCGKATDRILKDSISNETTDNVTALIICFKAFNELLFPSKNPKNLDTSLQAAQFESCDSSGVSNKENVFLSLRNDGVARGKPLVAIRNKESSTKRIEVKKGHSFEQRDLSINLSTIVEETGVTNPFKHKLQKIVRPTASLKSLNDV